MSLAVAAPPMSSCVAAIRYTFRLGMNSFQTCPSSRNVASRGGGDGRETEAGPGRELQARISQLSLLCPFSQSAQEFGFIIGEGSCAGEACDAPAADPRRCRRLLGSFSGSVAHGGHSYLAYASAWDRLGRAARAGASAFPFRR